MDIYTLIDFIAYTPLIDYVVYFAYIFTFTSAFVLAIYAVGATTEWIWNGGINNLIEEYKVDYQNRIAQESIERMAKLMRVKSMTELAYKVPEDIWCYEIDDEFLTELNAIRKLSVEVKDVSKIATYDLAQEFCLTQKYIAFFLGNVKERSF